jgi:hypothetical protein
LLSEREMDRADGQKQKHAKRASKEKHFSRTVDALFHCHCVPGEQPLLLEARQRCRDFSLLFALDLILENFTTL